MRNIIAVVIAWAFLVSSAVAQSVYGPPPSSVGVSLPGQVPGTATNDSAAAGNVGQYSELVIPAGSAISLTTNTPANIASVPLTAGDYDVSGVVEYSGAASTIVTDIVTGLNTTSATLPTAASGTMARADMSVNSFTLFNNGTQTLFVGPHRISLSGAATVYLIAQATFTVSTASAFGTLRIRRVR